MDSLSSRSRSAVRARRIVRGALAPLATLALLAGPISVAQAVDTSGDSGQLRHAGDKPKVKKSKKSQGTTQAAKKKKKKKKKKKAKVAKVGGYYEMPFPCGEAWTGTTRSNHSPSAYSVDWNRPDDVDDVVVASAPGVVTLVSAKDKGGYGKFVQLTHANGEATIYAHMNAVMVSVGQSVDQGTQIGIVGSTGNSTGPHLHYEQRTGASVSPAFFSGKKFKYGSTQVSANCVDVPMAGNMDGAPGSELVVFRRKAWGTFEMHLPGGVQSVAFGLGTDVPVLGDWDGDGIDDLGVYDQATGTFALWLEAGGVTWVGTVQWGQAGDLPVTGDWDGNGTDDLGVWRPSEATLYQRFAVTPRAAARRTASVPLGRPRKTL